MVYNNLFLILRQPFCPGWKLLPWAWAGSFRQVRSLGTLTQQPSLLALVLQQWVLLDQELESERCLEVSSLAMPGMLFKKKRKSGNEWLENYLLLHNGVPVKFLVLMTCFCVVISSIFVQACILSIMCNACSVIWFIICLSGICYCHIEILHWNNSFSPTPSWDLPCLKPWDSSVWWWHFLSCLPCKSAHPSFYLGIRNMVCRS